MKTPIDTAIDVLNEALAADPKAINELFAHRVECNEKFAEHPTIQVGRMTKDAPMTVGIMGLINGLFGTDENQYGFIMYRADEQGQIIEFTRYVEAAESNKP